MSLFARLFGVGKPESSLSGSAAKATPHAPLQMTEAEWKKKLSPREFYILREAGTEWAFTGAYWQTVEGEESIYHCAGCNLPLFSSSTKYDSGTGWPSFSDPLMLPSEVVGTGNLPSAKHVLEMQSNLKSSGQGVISVKIRREPFTQGGRREVLCARCHGHLGHVFGDGPRPTRQRYCMNSAAMKKELIE